MCCLACGIGTQATPTPTPTKLSPAQEVSPGQSASSGVGTQSSNGGETQSIKTVRFQSMAVGIQSTAAGTQPIGNGFGTQSINKGGVNVGLGPPQWRFKQDSIGAVMNDGDITPTTPTPPTTSIDEDNDRHSDDDVSNASDVDSDTPEVQIAIGDEEDTAEPWQDWIRRCTYEAEGHLKRLGAEDWVSTQRRRKWRWAQRVATEKNDKWTLRALLWEPVLDRRFHARRQQARPRKRWIDDITNYLTTVTINTQQDQQHTTQQEQCSIATNFVRPGSRQIRYPDTQPSHNDTLNTHNITATPSPSDADNNSIDNEDRLTTSNHDDDDDDVDTDGDDNGINGEAEDVEHTIAPVSWISMAQDWHKGRSLQEGFCEKAMNNHN